MEHCCMESSLSFLSLSIKCPRTEGRLLSSMGQIHNLCHFVKRKMTWCDPISPLLLCFLAFKSTRIVTGIVEVLQSSYITWVFCKTPDCWKLLINNPFLLKVFTATFSPTASKASYTCFSQEHYWGVSWGGWGKNGMSILNIFCWACQAADN